MKICTCVHWPLAMVGTAALAKDRKYITYKCSGRMRQGREGGKGYSMMGEGGDSYRGGQGCSRSSHQILFSLPGLLWRHIVFELVPVVLWCRSKYSLSGCWGFLKDKGITVPLPWRNLQQPFFLYSADAILVQLHCRMGCLVRIWLPVTATTGSLAIKQYKIFHKYS